MFTRRVVFRDMGPAPVPRFRDIDADDDSAD